jgi:hypothetical protein
MLCSAFFGEVGILVQITSVRRGYGCWISVWRGSTMAGKDSCAQCSAWSNNLRLMPLRASSMRPGPMAWWQQRVNCWLPAGVFLLVCDGSRTARRAQARTVASDEEAAGGKGGKRQHCQESDGLGARTGGVLTRVSTRG